MRPQTITQVGVGDSDWVTLQPNISPAQISTACSLSGTATYTVEYAYDVAQTIIFPDMLVQDYTQSAVAVQNDPVLYVRISISSGSGTVTASVVQAGIVQSNPNVPGEPTGLYNFGSVSATDLMYDVYERLGWRAASLTPDMMLSAQRSFNMVQTRWSNLGVNLWEVAQESITLEQGVVTYTLDSPTIDILPSPVIRLWQLSTDTDLTPAFSVTMDSTVCTVTQASNGLLVGNYINVATPVSVGGIVIFGFYPVISTPTSDTYTIELASAALSTESGGVVPEFTAADGSASVTVALDNQPFLTGQTFNVQVQTDVGGLNLLGQYLITYALTNSFVINATVLATSDETVDMNDGDAQIQSQPAQQLPTDRVLYPMSRADYTALAVKLQQGTPTSFWFDRTIVPTITFWPAPDAGGPYEFVYFKSTQMQDASIQNGALINIPYRFIEAYCAACAAHLAMKWRPELRRDLAQYAQEVWDEASDADREKVPFYISPDMSGYFG